MTEIVAATTALAEAWQGRPPAYSLKGWVALRDGKPLGMAGVYWIDGTPIAFSEWRDDLDRRTRVRAVRLVMGLIRGIRMPVYAVCGEHSGALLARLGFVPTGRDAMGGPLLVRMPR